MNRLIYADSESDSDLFYATGFLAPDAFLYFEKGRKKHIVLNALEYDRGVKQARVDAVHSLSDWLDELKRKKTGKNSWSTADWIAALLFKQRVTRVTVSTRFPVGLADELRKRRIQLQVATGNLFPERERKRPDEIREIRHSLKVTARLLDVAIQTLKASKPRPRDRMLIWQGSVLTSEKVQSLIRMEASRWGCHAAHPIVACGIQACDPHERGHGPLRGGELIVIDIFPKNLVTGYWGDMTRTVVRGKANAAQKKLFHQVHEAQKLALRQLSAGRNAGKIHEAVNQSFISAGYVTRRENGRYEGFFHGTGHGLGLDIHESPRVSAASHRLRTGEVVTVEPGLYYPEIGGVRIEDVVVIRAKGCELLSRYPVQLEI